MLNATHMCHASRAPFGDAYMAKIGSVPFSFEGAAVRAITCAGEPWLVLADVCRVLEIARRRAWNPSRGRLRLTWRAYLGRHKRP